MKPTRDELEYAISQYLDGTLNAVSQAALEETLAADADARALLAEYQRLDAFVKSALLLPDMAMDDLSQRIRNLTADAEMPIRHMRISPVWTKAIAMAAMVAIVVGAAVMLQHRGVSRNNINSGGVAVNSSPVEVEVSGPPAIASAPVSEISIAQPAGFASADYQSSEAIVSSPPSIWIASGNGSAQDNDPTLY